MAKKRSISKVVVSTLFALVLLAAIGIAFYFTNGFTTGFKTFYVSYNGKNIMKDTKLDLPINEEIRFDCKYVFGFLDDDTKNLGYSVDIMANYFNDDTFDFLADDEQLWFNAEDDLSSVFNLQFFDTYFTITISKNILLMLEAKYPGQEITLEPNDYSQSYYFLMVVSADDGSFPISIEFRADVNVPVERITLDKGGIVF